MLVREPALRECDRGGDLWSAFTIWMTVRVYTERQIVLLKLGAALGDDS